MKLINQMKILVAILWGIFLSACQTSTPSETANRSLEAPWMKWNDIYEMCGDLENPETVSACTPEILKIIEMNALWKECGTPDNPIFKKGCTAEHRIHLEAEEDIKFCTSIKEPLKNARCSEGIIMQALFRSASKLCREGTLEGKETNCTQEDKEWHAKKIDTFKCRLNSKSSSCRHDILKIIQEEDLRNSCWSADDPSTSDNCTPEMLFDFYSSNSNNESRFTKTDFLFERELNLPRPQNTKVIKNCYGTQLQEFALQSRPVAEIDAIECLLVENNYVKETIRQIRSFAENLNLEQKGRLNPQSPGWEYVGECKTISIVPQIDEPRWDIRTNDYILPNTMIIGIAYSSASKCAD